MRGLLADADSEGTFERLVRLLEDDSRRELWHALDLVALRFVDIGLDRLASDREVWLRCQAEELVLVTSNRNADGPDALEVVITELNEAQSLPVFTIADTQRVLNDREYAERAADRVLQYMFDMHLYRGTGRLFVP